MLKPDHTWMREFAAAFTVCDKEGTLVEMNEAAEAVFREDGGARLIGSNVMDCHPQEARKKFEQMMATQATSSYLHTENGSTRFFCQAPWYRDRQYSGYVEISFDVPRHIPHFNRE